MSLYQNNWSQTGMSSPVSDKFPSIALGSNGSTYVAFHTSYQTLGFSDIAVVKLSSTGSIVWRQQNSSFNSTGSETYPSIAVDSQENVYVAFRNGTENNGVWTDQIRIFKLSGDTGSMIWIQNYDGYYYPKVCTNGTDVYLTYFDSNNLIQSTNNLVTVKINPSTGQQVWTANTLGSTGATGPSVSNQIKQEYNIQNYATTDSIYISYQNQTNVWLHKISNSGTFLYNNLIGGCTQQSNFLIDKSGTIYVASSLISNNYYLYLTRLDSNLNVLESKTVYEKSAYYYPYIAFDKNGYYIHLLSYLSNDSAGIYYIVSLSLLDPIQGIVKGTQVVEPYYLWKSETDYILPYMVSDGDQMTVTYHNSVNDIILKRYTSETVNQVDVTLQKEFLLNSIEFSGKLFTFQNNIYSVYTQNNNLYIWNGSNRVLLQSSSSIEKIYFVFVDSSSVYICGSTTSEQGFYLELPFSNGSFTLGTMVTNATIPYISCLTKVQNQLTYFYDKYGYQGGNEYTFGTHPIKECLTHNNNTYIYSTFVHPKQNGYTGTYDIEVRKLDSSLNSSAPFRLRYGTDGEYYWSHFLPLQLTMYQSLPCLFFSSLSPESFVAHDYSPLQMVNLNSIDFSNIIWYSTAPSTYIFRNVSIYFDRLFINDLNRTAIGYGRSIENYISNVYTNYHFQMFTLHLDGDIAAKPFVANDLIDLFYDGDNTFTGTAFSYRGTTPQINLSLDSTPIGSVSATGGSFVYDYYPSPGSYTLTASYTGPLNYLQQEKQIYIQVNPIPTYVSVTGTPVNLVEGLPLTVDVLVSNPSYTIESGTVSLYNGSTLLTSSSVTATGSATFTVNGLTAGINTIHALYSGPSNYQSSTGTWVQNVTYGLQSDGTVSPTILNYSSGTPFVFTDPQNVNLSATASIMYSTSTGTTITSGSTGSINVSIPVTSYLTDKKIIYAPISANSTSATMMFKVIAPNGTMIDTLAAQISFVLTLNQKINNLRQSQNLKIKDSNGRVVGSATYWKSVGGNFLYNCTVSNGNGAITLSENTDPVVNTGNLVGTQSVEIGIQGTLYFGANNEWRVRTTQTTNEDRLLFEYYDDLKGWTIGVPFIIR